MPYAIRFETTGGPEVLQWVEHDRTAPYEVPLATSRSS